MSRSRDYDSEDYFAPEPSRSGSSGRGEETDTQEPGRAPSGSAAEPDALRRDEYERLSRNVDRQVHHDRDRTYLLRESEVAALVEIGKFRTVRTKDLVEVLYQNDTEAAARGLRNLKAQGLIERRTLSGTEKEQPVIVPQYLYPGI